MEDITELPPSNDDTPTQNVASTIFTYLLLATTLILTCGGNTLVIVTVARTPSLRTVTNVLLVNLAVADLMMGLIQFSAFLSIFMAEREPTHAACTISVSVVASVPLVSSFTLLGKCKTVRLYLDSMR